MRRSIITLGFVTAVFLAMPLPSSAANLPQIIPSCDETVYIVTVLKDGATSQQRMSPEQYDVARQKDPVNTKLNGYTTNKNCDFNDMLMLFMNLFNWGLYILSVLALFFLFLGGGTLLLSGGSEERIRTGKMILVNTVIGLGIALGSWTIVNVSIGALTSQDGTLNFLAQNQPWFRTTMNAQYQKCAAVPEYPCKGGEGEEVVREVQELLYDGGCYSSPDTKAKEVDGSFGPKTLAAWQLWQQANSTAQAPVPVSFTLQGYENFGVACRDVVP